jgi:hypothetical protein
VWIKNKVVEALKNKVISKSGTKYETGTTQIMGKNYVRYRFAMWRTNAFNNHDALFKKFKERYDRVKFYNPNLVAQRIGVSIASEEKIIGEFTNKLTGRKNKKELNDFISTASYMRNKPSTDAMFDELLSKLITYLSGNSGSPSILDEEEDNKKIKDFFVFFTQE